MLRAANIVLPDRNTMMFIVVNRRRGAGWVIGLTQEDGNLQSRSRD